MSRSIKVWSGSTWEDVGPALPAVTSQFIQLTNPASIGYIIRAAASQSANILQIQSNSISPLFTVEANGNMVINRAAANIRGSASGQYLTIGGSGAAGGVLELINTATDAINNYGTIVFGADGNTPASNKSIAQVEAFTSGTTANNRGGTLIFTTKADGGGNTERLRIDNTGLISSSGTFSIGPTTINGNLSITGTITAPIITYSINPQSGTTYTAALTDAASIITINNASANTVSIPTNASVAFPVGSSLTIIQTGSGNTTINAVTSGTTTIASNGATSNAPKLRTQYSAATAIKIQQTPSEVWYVVGDIA